MYQPEVKRRFIECRCNPKDGWVVYVDIDASEVGNAGGSVDSRAAMATAWQVEAPAYEALGSNVYVNANIMEERGDLPSFRGRSDIIAYHLQSKVCLIAEVEGMSSLQPEQKVYHAVGQLLTTMSDVNGETRDSEHDAWAYQFVVVVHNNDGAIRALQKMRVIRTLGIQAFVIDVENGVATLRNIDLSC